MNDRLAVALEAMREAENMICEGCYFAARHALRTAIASVDTHPKDGVARCRRQTPMTSRMTDSTPLVEKVAREIERYGEGLVPELRIVCTWLAAHFRNDEDARAALDASGNDEPKSYADWQQRRGMALDVIDWAIGEYDSFMLDDAYDAQLVLDRIAARLREVRGIAFDTRAAIAPTQEPESRL